MRFWAKDEYKRFAYEIMGKDEAYLLFEKMRKWLSGFVPKGH